MSNPNSSLMTAVVLTAAALMSIHSSPAIAGGETFWVGADAQCDFQQLDDAVAVAQIGDSVRVTANYVHDGEQINVIRGMTIEGGYAACESVEVVGRTRLASAFSWLMQVAIGGAAGDTVVLANLEMSGALPSAGTGGVLSVSGRGPDDDPLDVKIRNSSLSDGVAEFGGGLYVAGPKIEVALTEVTISNNQAVDAGGDGGFGGGIFCEDEAALSFSRVSIENNEAEFGGGGIALDKCALGTVFARDVKENLIEGNRVVDSQRGKGGGIFATQSELFVGVANVGGFVIRDNAVSASPVHRYDEDQFAAGGGAFVAGGVAVFTNVDFIDNSAPFGGAIATDGRADIALRPIGTTRVISLQELDPPQSLVEGNQALGYFRDGESYAGEGAVIYERGVAGTFGGPIRGVDFDGTSFLANVSECPATPCDQLEDGSLFAIESRSEFGGASRSSTSISNSLIAFSELRPAGAIVNVFDAGGIINIDRNTFARNADDISLFDRMSREFRITLNIFWDAPSVDFFRQANNPPLVFEHNVVRNLKLLRDAFGTVTIGPDNLDEDPHFRRPALGDFRLNSRSPAIDLKPRSNPTERRDLDGNFRPQRFRVFEPSAPHEDAGGYEAIDAIFANGFNGRLMN